MKYYFLLLNFLFGSCAFSQVAINTDNSSADSSAMLHVKSNSKGILIPRITEAQKFQIDLPATGLLIYQLNEENGFYYNAGTPLSVQWKLLVPKSAAWSTKGNAGISDSIFLGTLDNSSLTFRLNNIRAGLLDPTNQNIAYGISSLSSNTFGKNNIAIGWGTLNKNTLGNNMVAIGDSALFNQLTSSAYFNTAVGSKALFSNTTGYQNTAFGNAALIQNITGNDNTALGDGALRLNETGYVNTATGLHALYNNLNGTYNTAMAAFSLFNNISGNGNSAIGFLADVTQTNLNNATAIGYLAKVEASDKVRIGNVNVTSIGGQVGWTTFSDARYKNHVQEDIPGLAFISKLRPVSYLVDINSLNTHFGNDPKIIYPIIGETKSSSRQSGLLAQEVEIAARELNFSFSGLDKPLNETNLYGLRYSDFVVPMIKAIQEQQLEIKEQNKLIHDLTRKIKNLELEIKNK